VLEAKIFSKLCELATIREGGIFRLYHLGYAIGSKYAVELRNHRFGRSRVDDLNLRKSCVIINYNKDIVSSNFTTSQLPMDHWAKESSAEAHGKA